jgi:hypothetical protein
MRLVATAAISLLLVAGNRHYALFRAITVFAGMFLVRIYPQFKPTAKRMDVSLPIKFLIWVFIIGLTAVFLMGGGKIGQLLFRAEREAATAELIDGKKQFVADYDMLTSPLVNAPVDTKDWRSIFVGTV